MGLGGGSSNGCVVFDDVTIVEQIAVMDSLSPDERACRPDVLINGKRLRRAGQVSFGAISAVVNSWSDSRISVLVPDWLNPSPTHRDGAELHGLRRVPLNFTVTESPPPICFFFFWGGGGGVMGLDSNGLSPAKGRVGATVTLKGSSFGATRGKSVVKFGARTATQFVSWSDHQDQGPGAQGHR